jgi:hypothetical protein
MAAPTFDSARAVRFDLVHGSVQAGSRDERLLLVPAAALSSLVAAAPPEAAEALARALGTSIGTRASVRIGDLAGASVDWFVTQLAGEAALAGVGVLSIERWGRALVVLIERSPLTSTVLAPLVAAALEAAGGRRVWCTVLSHDEQVTRVLVASQQAVERVRNWMGSGSVWGEALAKLHAGAGA